MSNSFNQGGYSGYATIQEEGTPVTQRRTLNFVGASVTATDDAANSRTNVTVTASASSSISRGTEGARPTAASATNGLYYATDTGILWESNGSTWVPVATNDALEQGTGFYRSAIPRGLSGSNLTLTQGTEMLTSVKLYQGDTITNIAFVAGTTGYTAGTGGNLWFSLRDSSGNLVQTTADSAASTWGANNRLTLALALNPDGSAGGPQTITTTALYRVGIVLNAGTGGTAPTLGGVSGRSGELGNLGIGAAVLNGNGSASLTTPATAPAVSGMNPTNNRVQAILT